MHDRQDSGHHAAARSNIQVCFRMTTLYHCITDQHDVTIVLLAALICVICAMTTFTLLDQARRDVAHSFRWGMAGAFTAGIGAWSTHFVAMLGYSLNDEMSFDGQWTLLSLLAILLVAGLWTFLVSRSGNAMMLLLAGVICGLGIGAMHYVGIAGLELHGRLGFDTGRVIASLAVGVGFAMVAMQCFARLDGWKCIILSGLSLTLATASLHFLGMSALIVLPDPSIQFVGISIPKQGMILAITGLVICAGAISFSSIVAAEKVAEARAATAEAESNAKAALLTAVSHELRTPLHGIIGILEILKQKQQEDANHLPSSEHELIDTALACGHNLADLIDTVLDLSRLDRVDGEQKRVCDLHAVVAGAAGMLDYMAKKNELSIIVSAPSTLVRIAPGLVRQVLVNLLGNAIKFSREGEILIAVEKTAAEPSRYRFSVTDCGIGISTEAQKRIFGIFTQADETISQRFGGSGMGLSIAKKIVDSLGGAIGVASELGHGATFWFEIPLEETLNEQSGEHAPSQATAVAAVLDPQSAARGAAPRILIADDNSVNRMVASRLLRKLGATIDVAEDGQIAVEKCQHSSYDIILMDLQMPVMDGLAATREIRARQKEGRQPVIVAFSANSSTEDREAARESGMDDFMTKPTNSARLQEVLARWGFEGIASASPAPELAAT